MSKNASAPGFWHCGRCGTPNPAASYSVTCVACGASRLLARETAEARAEAQAEVEHFVPRIPRGPIGRWGKVLFVLSLVQLFALLIVWATLKSVGGTFWPAALVLLGPRWGFLAPMALLALLSIRANRWRIWAVQAAALLVLVVPIMGFNIPVASLFAAAPSADAPTVRLLSLNRGGVPIDSVRLIRYIELHKIDVVCFQELGKVVDPSLDAFFGDGWSKESDGYIYSRHPIVEEIPPPPERNDDHERYTMSVRRVRVKRPDGREFLVASMHMPTLTRGFSGAKTNGFDPKRFELHLDWWSKEFGRLVSTLSATQGDPIVAAGDLNMPSDHPQVAAMRKMGVFAFAFEERGWGFGYTKPPQTPWIRIDHVLASPDCAVSRCWIGPDFGSDHKSIVAEIGLPSSSAAPR